MILKQKSQMTNIEILDVEELIFPIIAEADEDSRSQKDAFVSLIRNNGEELVKLCYINNDGSKIEAITEKYRFQVMQDFKFIMELVFEESEGRESGKPQPQIIKKR